MKTEQTVARGGAETRRDLDEITGTIVDASVKLHQALGPGLLESVYEAVLARDLTRRGYPVERQIVSNLNPSASPRLRV